MTTGILRWDVPPQAVTSEQWASLSADGAPPGVYNPNMDAGWQGAWKAKMLGQRSPNLEQLRVEIRKTVFGRNSCAQVVTTVGADGSVMVSQNGRADYSAREWAERQVAVAEAIAAMEAYRAARILGAPPVPVVEALDAYPG